MTRRLSYILSGVTIVGSMLVSAAVVAALIELLRRAGAWQWYHWVIVSPLLYFSWLVAFLAISAATCRQVGKRYPKPRHKVVHPGRHRLSKEELGLGAAIICYRRLAILQSIPFVSVLRQFRPLDHLVMRAYSPSVHIGDRVINLGTLYDPDLTEIGDGVVIGGGAALVAHSMAIRSDGAMVYVSAPVRVGSGVTIGGGSAVSLGCVIGQDAVVELGSVLEPYTRVPAGEIWGGNPARFRRSREDVATAPPPAGAAGARPGPRAPDDDAMVRQVVLEALGLDGEEAPAELSRATCSRWDSLGQVAIAAAITERYGVRLGGPEVLGLRTLQDVVAAIAGSAAPPGRARHEPSTLPAAVLPPPSVARPSTTPRFDPEMLPLLDAQDATRTLAARVDERQGARERLALVIAASFVAQPLAPALKLWAAAFGLNVECDFAPYDQIVQTLLDRSDAFDGDRNRVRVVLARVEDLVSDSGATAKADDILAAVGHAAQSSGAGLIVGTLPPVVSPFILLEKADVEALRHRWRSQLETLAHVELFDAAGVVERFGIDRARSNEAEVLTRAPYSAGLYQELAIALVRRIVASRGPRARVIALDCEGTLWSGTRTFPHLQQHLKALKARGLLIAVVGRNEGVQQRFGGRAESVLTSADVSAWRVGRQPTSEKLRELSSELNVPLDAFVLLDADPDSRAEVQTQAPDVHVIPLPADPAGTADALARLWLFDGLTCQPMAAASPQAPRR